MNPHKEVKIKSADKTDIQLVGKKYSVWYKKDDNYLSTPEAVSSRSKEADFLKKTCTQLLSQLKNNRSITLIDIGANIGITTIIMGQIAQENKTQTQISKIYAFEPEPLSFECLQNNVSVFDGLIQCENYAIGERTGNVSFLVTPGSTSASHIVTNNHITGSNNLIVKVERLDYFVDKYQITNVGFIKIDVEGHERSVLNGAINTLEKYNPWIYMEFNSFTTIAYGGYNPREFLEYLLDWYKLVYIVDKVNGNLELIKSKTQALAFLHNNLVLHGCVDDLVLKLV